MKRFLLSFGLLASLTLLLGADFNSVKIPAVTVTVSDFTLDYSPASRSVSLQPDAGGTALSGTSDADGVVGFPRVTPGLYTLTISGVGLSPLTLRVPNQSGTLSASNLVISTWTPPSGAPYAGATDNLRAWSSLAPIASAVISGSRDSSDGKNLLRMQYAIGGNHSPNVAYRLDLRESTNSPFTGTISTTVYVENFLTNSSDQALYGFGGSFGVWGDSDMVGGDVGQGQGVGVFGSAVGGYAINYGVGGIAYGQNENSTNVGLAGASFGHPGKTNIVTVGAYIETQTDWVGGDPILQNSVLLLDNRDSALPLITARTNNGTTVFSVARSGLASSVAGFASTDTTAAVTIAATGWTNTFSKNAVVYYDGTNVTAKVYNNAGTAIYTNTAALSGGSVLLQPSGKVILSGTGVNGRATPF